MTDPIRILVTGGRHNWDAAAVARALSAEVAAAAPGEIVVVHGDSKTGIDRLARLWCEANGVAQDPHPADWDRYRDAAGPIRNEQMARLGAAKCLAFAGARGTANMRMWCRQYQILVVRVVAQ